MNLIGNGPDVLRKVTMLGNDFELSDGIWTCGKDGQSVPVGVGTPTMKIAAITVGGTKTDERDDRRSRSRSTLPDPKACQRLAEQMLALRAARAPTAPRCWCATAPS